VPAVDYAAALTEQNQQFGELTRAADPQTPVPGCPDWSSASSWPRGPRPPLVGHDRPGTLGHRRRPRTVADGKPPADPDGAFDWLRDSAGTVIDAVAQVGADVPVWTFLGPRPAAWWIRRRLHERPCTGGRGAGARRAVRAVPELAADGVSEWLDIVVGRAVPGPTSRWTPGARCTCTHRRRPRRGR